MPKQNPFLIVLFVMMAFGAIALLNASMTGYSVYGKLSSIFSGNTLSAMGGPLIVLTVIFTVSAVALGKITKQ